MGTTAAELGEAYGEQDDDGVERKRESPAEHHGVGSGGEHEQCKIGGREMSTGGEWAGEGRGAGGSVPWTATNRSSDQIETLTMPNQSLSFIFTRVPIEL